MHNLTTGRYKHFFEFPRNKVFRPQEKKPSCHLGMFKKQMYARSSTSAWKEKAIPLTLVQKITFPIHMSNIWILAAITLARDTVL